MLKAKSTVLMTGATGYLGSHLAHKVSGDGHKLVILKRSTSDTYRIKDLIDRENPKTYDLDQTDQDSVLKRALSENKVDLILHCATNYGRRELDPITIIEANLILPLKILKLAVDYKVPAFVNTDTLLDKRINAYSLSKKQFFEWMKTYSSQISCANVALEHFYGPDDDPSKFVSMIVHQILAKVPSIALTRGEQKRDFIYIDDVVEGFVSILYSMYENPQNHPAPGLKHFEIGSGSAIRIRDFVELVRRISKNSETRLDFGALPYRENEVMESKVDLTSLLALGWKARVGLEEGITKMINQEKIS